MGRKGWRNAYINIWFGPWKENIVKTINKQTLKRIVFWLKIRILLFFLLWSGSCIVFKGTSRSSDGMEWHIVNISMQNTLIFKKATRHWNNKSNFEKSQIHVYFTLARYLFYESRDSQVDIERDSAEELRVTYHGHLHITAERSFREQRISHPCSID